MNNFSSIDFHTTIERFKIEENAGRRYRMGDLSTSLWLKRNNINFGHIKQISSELPDARIVIIGEGDFKGFYIYSNLKEKCFRYSEKMFETASTI